MLKITLFLSFIFCGFVFAESEDEILCEVNNDILPQVIQMENDTLKVGLLLVQFADADSNIDARGSVGFSKSDTAALDIDTLYNKYHHQDYWNIFFSGETYVDPEAEEGIGGLHPDWDSHQRIVYGSFKDYWWEVSHKNLTIVAPTTLTVPTGDPIKDTGIINKINADGILV